MAVSILSRYNHKPGINHWKEVVHCWKYLKGTRDISLTLHPDSNHRTVQFYSNATWADDPVTRISQRGNIAFWLNFPVLWYSKKQRNITMSSTKSELSALSDGVQENLWFTTMISELWNSSISPTTFHIDNKGLLDKLKHFGLNSKTKHIDIKMKYI